MLWRLDKAKYGRRITADRALPRLLMGWRQKERKDPGRISPPDQDDNFNQDKTTLQRSLSAPPPIHHALALARTGVSLFISAVAHQRVAPAAPLRSAAVARQPGRGREQASSRNTLADSPSSPACPLTGKSGRGAQPPCAPPVECSRACGSVLSACGLALLLSGCCFKLVAGKARIYSAK